MPVQCRGLAFASGCVCEPHSRPQARLQEVQAAVAQPCGDGQVESRRAMHSPVRDIHIGRPAAVAVPNSVLRQPVLVRAGRQEARFFNLRVQSSRLGSGGQNGTRLWR